MASRKHSLYKQVKNSFDKSSNFRGDFYFDKKVQGIYIP